MQNEQHTEIIASVREYMEAKGISQKEMAKYADVNEAYLSTMLNGGTHIGDVEITRRYWNKLGTAVGQARADEVWQVVKTPQHTSIMAELVMAKTEHKCISIIGEPGIGKTLSISRFREQYPKHTYVVTINSLVTVGDILHDLLRQLDIPSVHSKAIRLYSLIVKLRDIKQRGGHPIIIFDEAENMEAGTMKLIKGLYDGISKYASIVLMGTKQLVRKMQRNRDKDRDAAPQFYRRFYPGIKYLSDIDRKYKGFFDLYELPHGLRNLLISLCNNYGELNAYLEPALKEASKKGVALGEDLFREIHNLPY